MILWSIQDYHAYEKLMDTGILVANEDYVFEKEYFAPVYDWLYKQMVKSIGIPPPGVKYPIWAWYQWEGKRKKRDMRNSGYAERGKRIVRLTIDIDPQKVLLSDFDLYNYPLNFAYLGLTENEDLAFDRECQELGFTLYNIQDCTVQTDEMLVLRHKILKSWERIFNLALEPNEWAIQPMSTKSVQATMWYVRKSHLIKAEEFISR